MGACATCTSDPSAVKVGTPMETTSKEDNSEVTDYETSGNALPSLSDGGKCPWNDARMTGVSSVFDQL